MSKKKNAFTLIELIAVLVILAIIALIVTPLVMNIVKKAKDSANKRSVDAYGKAVELGVATYLLDNGEYPTDLNGLTIEYSGNEVVCNVKTLNEDGGVYLSECSVKGAEVKDSKTDDGYYHYGKTANKDVTYQAYKIGDTVTYNEMEFYVIEDSDESSDRVTMLKAEPLTVDEVNTYGVGHVNRYTASLVGTVFGWSGYGGMAYYTSETCGYVNGSLIETGCTTDYSQSEIKYVVDAWTINKFLNGDLVEDATGYSARLLTFEDLTNNLGVTEEEGTLNEENTPIWLFNENFYYWTMSVSNAYDYEVLLVTSFGDIFGANVRGNYQFGAVRPVVTIKKSAI